MAEATRRPERVLLEGPIPRIGAGVTPSHGRPCSEDQRILSAYRPGEVALLLRRSSGLLHALLLLGLVVILGNSSFPSCPPLAAEWRKSYQTGQGPGHHNPGNSMGTWIAGGSERRLDKPGRGMEEKIRQQPMVGPKTGQFMVSSTVRLKGGTRWNL